MGKPVCTEPLNRAGAGRDDKGSRGRPRWPPAQRSIGIMASALPLAVPMTLNVLLVLILLAFVLALLKWRRGSRALMLLALILLLAVEIGRASCRERV